MEIIDAGKVRICVAATRVSGRDYVDVRIHVTDDKGRLRPTQQGLLIPVEVFSDVMDAGAREQQFALAQERPPLYYFKETVIDKRAIRTEHSSRVQTSITSATLKTPIDYGADENRGFIFKCRDYELVHSTYQFKPTRPFAVWDKAKNKWVRWNK